MDKDDVFSDERMLRALEGELGGEERLAGRLAGDAALRREYEGMRRAWLWGRYAGKWGRVDDGEAWRRVARRYRGMRRRRLWGRVAVAALLVLAVGVTVLWWQRGGGQDVQREAAPLAEVVPGRTTAYLVLASGEQVELGERRGAGEFERQVEGEGVRIERDSAGLVYGAGAGAEGRYNELVVPRGGEYRLQLGDGTVVYLNAGSRLRYPVAFGAGSREVELEGEGYFEVARDAGRPFRVRTAEVAVDVLGTGFNVAAYEGDGRVEVTLVHGQVAVEEPTGRRMLAPDEQLVFDRGRQESRVSAVDAGAVAAWTKGLLMFDGMPLGELAVKLERWFDVEFFFASEALKELKFTGALKKYSEIAYILRLMEATTDIRLQLQGRTVVVEPK